MSKNPNAHKGQFTDIRKRTKKQRDVREEGMTMEQKIAEREARSIPQPAAREVSPEQTPFSAGQGRRK